MTEPRWLTTEIAIAIHEAQLIEHGGPSGIRDIGMLESALERPKNKWAYEGADLAALAAAYGYGVAKNHPFIDGNKRTAHVCYRVFLRLNGGDLAASDEEKYAMTLGLAEGTISEAEFAEWLRPRITMSATGKVQEPPARYAR